MSYLLANDNLGESVKIPRNVIDTSIQSGMR